MCGSSQFFARSWGGVPPLTPPLASAYSGRSPPEHKRQPAVHHKQPAIRPSDPQANHRKTYKTHSMCDKSVGSRNNHPQGRLRSDQGPTRYAQGSPEDPPGTPMATQKSQPQPGTPKEPTPTRIISTGLPFSSPIPNFSSHWGRGQHTSSSSSLGLETP